MRRAALRLALRGLVVSGLVALCSGCVPIGARWSNMFTVFVG
jgi:hypothetical protein